MPATPIRPLGTFPRQRGKVVGSVLMGGDLGLWAVPVAMLGGAIRVSTPYIFVSLGECLTERSGRINLGLEGTLVLGAMSAYGVALVSGSPWLGVVMAAGVGLLMGALHA